VAEEIVVLAARAQRGRDEAHAVGGVGAIEQAIELRG
jgi:hypothetical protein